MGEVIEVGTTYNNIDVRPFAEYGCTPENNQCEIKLSNSGVKCFSTDQIYDNSRTDYANKYLEMIKSCDIVDMEAYALAKICKLHDIKFKCFKYISDYANNESSNDWIQNCHKGASEFLSLYPDCK